MTYRETFAEDEERRYGDRYGGYDRQYVEDYAADPLHGSRRYGEDYGVTPAWRWRGHTGWQGANLADWQGPAGPEHLGQRPSGDFRERGFDQAPQPARGPHAGKGPRGYQRTDDRIREDVNYRLTEDGFVDAMDIEVLVDQGVVHLHGEVDDRPQKRRAEDVAESVAGVKDVRNELHVRRASPQQQAVRIDLR